MRWVSTRGSALASLITMPLWQALETLEESLWDGGFDPDEAMGPRPHDLSALVATQGASERASSSSLSA